MSKEQEMYDAFVDVLTEKLKGEPTAQELAVVFNFLKYNNIQATEKHKGLSELAKSAMELPFEDEEQQPLRRIK